MKAATPGFKPRSRGHKATFALATLITALSVGNFSIQAQTVGFTADIAGPNGGAANNGGLNIGHTFTVNGSGIVVYELGVYDFQGNGLLSSHTVTLFSDAGATHTAVAGGSITVPAGTTAPLKKGFRFAPLTAPLTLPAGNYSVVVYQMNGNGNGSDGYAEANNTGFNGDGKVSSSGFTVFEFTGNASPAYPTASSSGGNLASASFTYLPILTSSDYGPLALTPGSYNQDAIVELGAPSAPASVSTATMDAGTGNSGTTWYEIGANSGAPSSGIPLHGSTFTSASLPDHSYKMAPDYHTKNVVLIDGAVTSGTISVTTPGAFSSLSFLVTSGNGSTTFGYTVHHADASIETGTFVGGDWFGGANPAVTANGRVTVPNSFSAFSGNPRIYSADIALANTASPVTSIDLTHSAGTGHGAVFAVSGSTGGAFSPMTITGFNQDVVVEATGALNGNYTTVSMDSGTGNSANSWYEQGYDTAAVNTGIPAAGSIISSASASDHYYTFAPSYAANDVVFIDPSHGGNLTLANPDTFSVLSFLTSAGGGNASINYSVNHADGTSETGSFTSPDWFNNTPVAWTANGRVDVSSGSFNNVNGNNPRIYSVDILLLNSGSQVTNIVLSYGGGTRAVVFALSGLEFSVPPTAPFSLTVTPSSLTQYVGGTASFTVTAGGTLPFGYQWNKGGVPIAGATASKLTLSGLTSGDAANYSCTVSNAGGSTPSANVALTVLSLPLGVAGAVLSDLPLAYYRLNEPGPLVPDVATNSGSLGSAGDARYFPGGLHQVAGALAGDPDTAAGYTGIDTSSEDGAVTTIVPFNAALNPSGSFTVETWLMPTLQGNLGNAQSPLNNGLTDINGNRFGWDFFQRAAGTQTPDANGPGYSFRMFNGTDGGETSAKLFNITGGSYQVGAWSHLVAVYDASVPSATLYFNGQQVAQSTTPNGTYAPNPSAPLGIGGYADGRQNPFVGSMDEFAIYTNALSAGQVLAHYQNGTNAARSTSYPSLVTSDGAAEYLRLDEPSHNVALNQGRLGSLADGTYSHTGNGAAGPEAPALGGFEAGNLAPSFNGNNSYVELENPAGLNFTGQLTLEAWIEPAASQGFESYILAHGGNDDFSGEVSLRIENGVYQIGSNHGHAALPVTAGDLGGNQWIHLVGTYDGANWNLYRNGVLGASGADNIGPFLVNNANWAIGARGKWRYAEGYPDAGLDRQYNGLIDEVAVYDHALTPARVQAHYAVSVQQLKISRSGNQATVTWPLGTLQQADFVTGPYTDLTNGITQLDLTPTEAQKFYRVKY